MGLPYSLKIDYPFKIIVFMNDVGPMLGVALHGIGGVAAATCYISQKGTRNWSWQSYWIVVCVSAWFLMPLFVSYFATPDLLGILKAVDAKVAIQVSLLGVAYGFGGMAFAISIRHIGFSLTYAIAIGISAVFGTIVPSIIDGMLIQNFQKEGGTLVLVGFLVSMAGVAVCGRAGFMKEAELKDQVEDGLAPSFDMKKGLFLVVLSGVLAGVFGVAVSAGAPIDQISIEYGAKATLAGYPKYIFITGGTLVTNLVWWGVVHFRSKTMSEFISSPGGGKQLTWNYLMGIVAGVLWFTQFIFYELGHAHMGDYGFISWGVHMTMLVFFSFGVGLLFKEWANCRKNTLVVLTVGLVTLFLSFSLITYGSWVGDQKNVSEVSPAAMH